MLQGSWPLLLSAGLLALFNWATLLIAGHPWSITWAFTLWAAKAAMALGWDVSSNWFWSGGFTARALLRPILADVTSVMNIGIIFGALLAASMAGKIAPKTNIPMRSLLAAVVGGLLLGYGARLSYGCNIGAFFSGVASTSLHGWAWIVFGIAGNFIGVRLRPLFQL
ncbi:MAG: YeeE/YedE family protein [Rhodospirillales bacterium]|nr:YeeE/YedE family protein [Rhodospirillales bacterium]